MDRREHTFRLKFKEMIRALQLERMYTKNEILEFYLNQFHVTANGNGIGIAAKYYFSKEVEDLNLIEAAFIAGSVKAPSKYNPFTKYTKEERKKAADWANERKNYVLRRMFEQGWIDKQEFQESWDQPVPFQHGTFTSREVALVSLIRSQLDKKEILDAVGLDSIQEINQAGLRVYTTIDDALQKNAQLAVRRNLSRLEYILEGFKVEDPQNFAPLRELEVNQFYFGKVSHVERGPNGYIELDFGLPVGRIPYESVDRTAKILNLVDYLGVPHHIKAIFDTVKIGDVLLSEIKSYDRETHKAVLELKKFPTINGGLIAVDKGEVRAVVAGFEAQGFNRAMFSTRQPGSVFKSVIYYTALQLGWNITDQLDNERRVFPFQGHLYYPRPDHASPYPSVSMVWAGVKSENLASVYLAGHLVDKLNFGQFKQLMGHLDLLPIQGEAVSDYHYRVAKTIGVQLDSTGIKQQLLSKAVEDLKPDLVFSGRADLLKQLSKIWWGNGYITELKHLQSQTDDDLKVQEMSDRIDLLMVNYERYLALSQGLSEDWNAVRAKISESGPEGALASPAIQKILSRFRVLAGSASHPSLGYVRTLPEEDSYMSANSSKDLVLQPVPGRALSSLDVQMIWGASGYQGDQANVDVDDVFLGGQVPNGILKRITSNLNTRYDAVMAEVDSYGLFRYFNHHDFRIALGLNYAVKLSKAMGVYSKLEPVLSFPLGTNAVSVAEVAKIYQTFVDGKIYRFYEEGPSNQLNLIKRIEDRNGVLVYEPKASSFQLVDECQSEEMTEILGKVVTHGTGRRARGELQFDLSEPEGESKPDAKTGKVSDGIKIRVPAYGKTGTTNDYTTAYFAGFVPYPSKEKAPLSLQDSMVIASYVGYDLNRSMRRGGMKITGALGALPAWTDFGRQMLEEFKYRDYVDKLDLSLMKKRTWPLAQSKCGVPVPVDLPRGIAMGGDGGDTEVFDSTDIEKDGESNTNEFARNASIRTMLTLTRDARAGIRNLALFAQSRGGKANAVSDTVSKENKLDNVGGGPIDPKGALDALSAPDGPISELPANMPEGGLPEADKAQVKKEQAVDANSKVKGIKEQDLW